MYTARNRVLDICRDVLENRFRKYEKGAKEYVVVTSNDNAYTNFTTYFVQVFHYIMGYRGDDISVIYSIIKRNASDILCILHSDEYKPYRSYEVVYNNIKNGPFLYKTVESDCGRPHLESAYRLREKSKLTEDKYLQSALDLYIKSLDDILSCLPF